VIKVCHLSTVHPTFDTRILHKECRSLARASHEVHLLIPHDRDEVVNGVRIEGLPRSSGRVRRMTVGPLRLLRRALRLRADVYHFHDPELMPVGLILRALGKKVVYDVHEDLPRTFEYKDYLKPWLRGVLSWVADRVENTAARYYSGVVTATPIIAGRFRRRKEVVVVQNYPILDELLLPDPVPWEQRPPSVAYVGSISRERGILEMVRAMNLLPASTEGTLELAGTFSPPGLLQEAASLPGWNRVRYLGHLGRDGVRDLLGRVRAGLVVLHPEQNYLDSQPIKMYEYMSAGLPLIASDFPLWRPWILPNSCGWMVDPLDPGAIAGAIQRVLADPAGSRAMGERGRKAVEETFNWAPEERKLLDLYDRLTRSRN